MRIIEHVTAHIRSHHHLNGVSKFGEGQDADFIDFYSANPANYRNREYVFTVVGYQGAVTVVDSRRPVELDDRDQSVTLQYELPDFFESLDAAVARLLATLREKYKVMDDVV